MAKKTTAGKTSSRQKKSAEDIEDAEVVDSSSPTAADENEAATQDAMSEASEPAETGEAESSETAESSVEDAADDMASEDAADDMASEAAADEATDMPADEDTAEADDQDAEVQTEAETDPDPSDESYSKPEPGAAATPAPAAAEKSSSSVPLIFGGLLAGAIGFGAAYFSGTINPPPAPEPVDLSGVEQSIEAQGQRLDELAASVSEAGASAVDTSALEASIASVVESLAALEARVAALESRPAGTGGAADPAVLEELNALRATVDQLSSLTGAADELTTLRETVAALQDENEAAKANARSEAAGALQRAAMTRVQTALDTGAAFADALSELEQLGVDVPASLSEGAADGVPTLASLQDGFPAAARDALAADRAAAAESGETGGVMDFFRSQLGARSLTPQEGDGTDAVLSRAEHALHEGRLTDALAELATLPDVAQPAMADWSSTAAARADALSAAQALMDSLN